MHPESVWELTAQLAPVTQSLDSSPEANGGALTSLHFLIQISLSSNTTSPKS